MKMGWQDYLNKAEKRELEAALKARDTTAEIARLITRKLKSRAESRMRQEAKKNED